MDVIFPQALSALTSFDLGSRTLGGWKHLVWLAAGEITPEAPSGPMDWPLKSWVGFFVYIGVFVALVFWLVRLDRRNPPPSLEEENPPE